MSFKRVQTLKLHERTHTGEKPFHCEDCPQKYSTRSALTNHRKKNHAKWVMNPHSWNLVLFIKFNRLSGSPMDQVSGTVTLGLREASLLRSLEMETWEMERMMRWFPVVAGSPLSTTTCNYTTGNEIMRVCKRDDLAICIHVLYLCLGWKKYSINKKKRGWSKVDLIIILSHIKMVKWHVRSYTSGNFPSKIFI